jgi:hypothetical protein
MGKKGNGKVAKKKLTKKEKKQQSHLKLIQGKKGQDTTPVAHDSNKKAA